MGSIKGSPSASTTTSGSASSRMMLAEARNSSISLRLIKATNEDCVHYPRKYAIGKIDRFIILFQKLFQFNRVFKLAVKNLGIIEHHVDIVIEEMRKIFQIVRSCPHGQEIGDIVNQGAITFSRAVGFTKKSQVTQEPDT